MQKHSMMQVGCAVDSRVQLPFQKCLRHFIMGGRGRFKRVRAGSCSLGVGHLAAMGTFVGSAWAATASVWTACLLCGLLQPLHILLQVPWGIL